jgi:tryptophan-rich sensory protein
LKRGSKESFGVFMIQLALNALWSYLFGLHNPMLAGIEIIILWLMILKPTQFVKINKIVVIYCYPLSCLGKFCCGFKWKYLVVE